jgi:hypothetical protein
MFPRLDASKICMRKKPFSVVTTHVNSPICLGINTRLLSFSFPFLLVFMIVCRYGVYVFLMGSGFGYRDEAHAIYFLFVPCIIYCDE